MPLSLSLSLFLSHSFSLTLSHALSHTLSLTLSHSLTHSLSLTLTHSLTHPLSLSLSLSLTHSLSHTHTHTHTLSLCLSILSHRFCAPRKTYTCTLSLSFCRTGRQTHPDVLRKTPPSLSLISNTIPPTQDTSWPPPRSGAARATSTARTRSRSCRSPRSRRRCGRRRPTRTRSRESQCEGWIRLVLLFIFLVLLLLSLILWWGPRASLNTESAKGVARVGEREGQGRMGKVYRYVSVSGIYKRVVLLQGQVGKSKSKSPGSTLTKAAEDFQCDRRAFIRWVSNEDPARRRARSFHLWHCVGRPGHACRAVHSCSS